jgi:syntaxin 1B/2/3
MEQEPLVQNIEQKGEEIQDNMVKANEQLDMGVKSARGARKKKWICLAIVVAVVIIVAIAVGAYIAVNHPFSSSKSSAPAATSTPAARMMVRTVQREMMKRNIGGLEAIEYGE